MMATLAPLLVLLELGLLAWLSLLLFVASSLAFLAYTPLARFVAEPPATTTVAAVAWDDVTGRASTKTWLLLLNDDSLWWLLPIGLSRILGILSWWLLWRCLRIAHLWLLHHAWVRAHLHLHLLWLTLDLTWEWRVALGLWLLLVSTHGLHLRSVARWLLRIAHAWLLHRLLHLLLLWRVEALRLLHLLWWVAHWLLLLRKLLLHLTGIALRLHAHHLWLLTHHWSLSVWCLAVLRGTLRLEALVWRTFH